MKATPPQLAPVRDDRSIRLFAMHAEVYGPHLVFEPKYRNLGFWQSDQDRAVWTMDAPKPGEYEVNLDFSCAPQDKTNRFQLLVNGQKIAGEISSTGSWDQYEWRGVGRITLPDEPVRVTVTQKALSKASCSTCGPSFLSQSSEYWVIDSAVSTLSADTVTVCWLTGQRQV